MEFKNTPKTEDDMELAKAYEEVGFDMDALLEHPVAQKFEKNVKRLRGKLQYFGIYRKQEQKPKQEKAPVTTKQELVEAIAELVGEELDTLTKANKPDLEKLLAFLVQNA